MTIKGIILLLSIFMPLLLVACSAHTGPAQDGAAPLRVALVSDAECTDPPSRDGAWEIISNHPGFDARRISAGITAEGGLDEFDVVIFPGGSGSGQGRALGVDGGHAVTEFVRRGGGVVAICAGGYLTAEGYNEETRACELVNARLHDLSNWARGQGFIDVEIMGRDGDDAVQSMWFQNGPILVPAGREDLPVYTTLVRYASDMAASGAPEGMLIGRDAIVAAPFGEGRVVVFGPHPELSPGLHHWLVNAIVWTARNDGGEPTVGTVLEGK